ncbi:hypothetical protein ACFL59_08145 [Planctomycetota bacterium]
MIATASSAPTTDETKRIDSVLRRLNRAHAYMAAEVVRLGIVDFSTQVDTAGILVDGAKVTLLFDRRFFHKLRDPELAAVLTHEAMHFAFRHQERSQLVRNSWDRHLFNLACEAVINDLICRFFPDMELPGEPVRGQELVGRDASDLTVERVVRLLKDRLRASPNLVGIVSGLQSLDDHSVWISEETEAGGGAPGSWSGVMVEPETGWTRDSDDLLADVVSSSRRRDAYGSSPAGVSRFVPVKQVRANLRRFLVDHIRPTGRYATVWSRPNRKSLVVYPDVILPLYTPEERPWRVLMALDASGSVPPSFLGAALSVAKQRMAGTVVTLISFDTEAYELRTQTRRAKGGGGTRAQAVERYARANFKPYPDYIFLFTDGQTPSPQPLHPDRWIWVLPPWGSTRAMPRRTRSVFFSAKELR